MKKVITTKKVKVFCTQLIYYNYELDVPDNVDVEDYVYSFLRDYDEIGHGVDDCDEPNVEDIEECGDFCDICGNKKESRIFDVDGINLVEKIVCIKCEVN